MTFSDLNLNRPLLNALEDIGLVEPTPIQEQAFSSIMSGRDVVGTAQTGTGKTYAYLLPLLRWLPFSEQRAPRVLIIVPTRELVVQVTEEIEKLSAYMACRVTGVYGGTNIRTQTATLMQGQDVVVATPGRLVDLILNSGMSAKFIKKLVIDEVDEMLNLGFRAQLTTLIDLLPTKRQNLLFSATMTEDVEIMIEQFFNNPIRIAAAKVSMPAEKIEQYVYHIPNFNSKVNLITSLLKADEDMKKILIFVGNKKRADKLHEELSELFPDQLGVIHSNKSQNYRLRTVKKFAEGTFRGLIATDIIARGLDVENVSHVINFNTPEIPENYVHRVGRTARANADGIAVTFVAEKEIPFLKSIEELIEMSLPDKELPEDVVISELLIPDEIERLGGDKDYIGSKKLETTKGAFHEKNAKNSFKKPKRSLKDRKKMKTFKRQDRKKK